MTQILPSVLGVHEGLVIDVHSFRALWFVDAVGVRGADSCFSERPNL